jgi:hypothetical protein
VAEQKQWLEKTLLPNAKGDFRIGQSDVRPEAAVRMLSSLSRAEIKQRAEGELKRVRERDVRHRPHRAEGQGRCAANARCAHRRTAAESD